MKRIINKNSGMNKIKFLFCILTAAVVLTSCLDDKKYLDLTNTGTIIEFPLGQNGSLNVFSVLPGTPTTDTAIALNIASPQVLDRDVTVIVRPNVTAVTDYNTVHGTNFEFLPDSLYTVENYKVTIPAGYRIGRLKIKFNFPKFDLSGSYAVAFEIAEVSPAGITISGNYNTFLWTLGVRNKWDGVYSIRGYTLREGDADRTGLFGPLEVELRTAGPNSVDLYPGHVWGGPVGGGIAATITPRYTINNDNTLTLTSSGGPFPAGITNSSNRGTSYPSRYVPATKTFFAEYTWSGGITNRLATDTLRFLRLRD
jgi:hypothetical protein